MALLADESFILSNPHGRQSAMTNGTGTIVATDDGWLGARGNGDAFWDGDDMSLEMVTDVNDGDVDEEVGFIITFLLSLLFPFPAISLLLPQCKKKKK